MPQTRYDAQGRPIPTAYDAEGRPIPWTPPAEAVPSQTTPEAPRPAPTSAAGAITEFGYGATVEPVVGTLGLIYQLMQQSPQEGTATVLKGLGQAQGRPYQEMWKALDAGRVDEAILQGAAWLTPVVGPAVMDIVDEARRTGNWSVAMGRLTALAGPGLVGRMRGVGQVKVPGVARAPEADIVEAGLREGVNVDAGQALGGMVNRIQQGLEKGTPGGAVAAWNRPAQQGAQIEAWESRLASRAHPTAVTPEEAGAGTLTGVRGHATQQNRIANVKYETLRQAEADATPQRVRVTVQSNRGPVMMDVDMPMPVDVRGVQQTLQPLLDQLERQMPIAQQEASIGLKALRNLRDAQEFIPLSVADADLGSLKALLRKERGPTVNASLLTKVIKELEQQVRTTARSAGPEVERLLLEGRQATTAKWNATRVVERLAGRDATKVEPVAVFNKLTRDHDQAVSLLRQVQREAPDVLPQVGRAWLEDVFTRVTTEGRLSGAKSASNAWEKLGPETRTLLFRTPGLVEDLDTFFRLVRRMGEDVNPSGTAHTYRAIQEAGKIAGLQMTSTGLTFSLFGAGGAVLANIGAYQLVRALQNPTVVKALIRGLEFDPSRPLRAGARATATAELLRTLQPYLDRPESP